MQDLVLLDLRAPLDSLARTVFQVSMELMARMVFLAPLVLLAALVVQPVMIII